MVNLVSNRRAGQCVPALSPNSLLKSLSGTCLGTGERAGKQLLGQGSLCCAEHEAIRHSLRDFQSAPRGDFVGSCRELNTWLYSAQVT